MVGFVFRLGCVVCLSLTLSACLGRPVATYNWQFRQVSAEATARDEALPRCEAKAKRRNREIRGDFLRIWSYAEAVEFCMKQEGWESIGRPVTVGYV